MPDGVHVQTVDAHLVVGRASGYKSNSFTLGLFGGRRGNHSIGILIGGQRIVALRTVDFPVQLGHVAKVVKGERIVGIEQVRLIKEFLARL